jgi:hypothetical protein
LPFRFIPLNLYLGWRERESAPAKDEGGDKKE